MLASEAISEGVPYAGGLSRDPGADPVTSAAEKIAEIAASITLSAPLRSIGSKSARVAITSCGFCPGLQCVVAYCRIVDIREDVVVAQDVALIRSIPNHRAERARRDVRMPDRVTVRCGTRLVGRASSHEHSRYLDGHRNVVQPRRNASDTRPDEEHFDPRLPIHEPNAMPDNARDRHKAVTMTLLRSQRGTEILLERGRLPCTDAQIRSRHRGRRRLSCLIGTTKGDENRQ
jgi:hypothetical protein